MLLFNEMKIREGLVFDKHNCKLIGFTDLGSINNTLTDFEQECDGEKGPINADAFASHMLCFMVRGICSDLKFPYANFPTRRITSAELYPIVGNTVENLEALGFNVMAITCDGAAHNRRVYKMHFPRLSSLTYKIKNVVAGVLHNKDSTPHAHWR